MPPFSATVASTVTFPMGEWPESVPVRRPVRPMGERRRQQLHLAGLGFVVLTVRVVLV